MDYQRPSGFRFLAGGVDLRNPPDSIAPNKYACALNVRWYAKQGLRARPGYLSLFRTAAGQPVTDVRAYSTLGTDELPRWIACDTNYGIYLDTGNLLITLAGGAGGVSLIPFRPAASPQSWMYVASNADYQKLSAPAPHTNAVVVQKVGIQEPTLQVEAAPLSFEYTDFSALATDWVNGGTAGALSDAVRISDTVLAVFPDPANTNRVSCQVGVGVQYQIGELTNQGIVQDVLPPIPAGLTIQAIRYWSGTSGRATIVPSQLPLGTEIPGVISAGYLRRGALVELGGSEVDMVLSVVDGPGGLVSFDVVTTATFAAGNALAGVPAIVVDAATAAAITAAEISTVVTAGVGTLTQTLAASPFGTELGASGLFPQEDDYVHLSVLISNPTQILELKLLFNVDPSDSSFEENAYYYSIAPSILAAVVTGQTTQTAAAIAATEASASTQNLESSIANLTAQAASATAAPEQEAIRAQIAALQNQLNANFTPVQTAGSTVTGSSQWTEILFPVSSLQRIGNNQAVSLVNTNAVQVYVNVASITAQWENAVYYPVGYEIVDPSNHIQSVTTAGISGATQPVWNDSGGTTSDGTVVWTDLGLYSTSVSVSISSFWIGGGGQPDVGDVGADYSYQCKPRSSLTGVPGNPTPDMRYGVRPRRQPVIVKTSALAAPDPQVDTWDIYRYGGSVTSYRYVGSAPIGSDWTDTYFDDSIATNNTMATDDFEPWPSVDLPYSQMGGVTVCGQWLTVAGTLPATVTRWLPGTLVIVGGLQGFTLRSRPTLLSAGVYLFELEEAAGFGSQSPFQVQEPILARQCLQSVWGPDANGVFFGVMDSLRPGVVSWSKPYAPDAVPSANNKEICSPNEPLLGGAVRAGISLVFSPSRWWALYPDFNNPGAYTPVESPVGRGGVSSFAHVCDGARVFFWTRDGIAATDSGPFQSLTEEDLYTLWNHDGAAGANVVRNGVTFYAPDYSKASTFRLGISNNYLYASYQDTGGIWRVLVCDLASGAWVQDQYADQITAAWGLHGQPGTLLSDTSPAYTRMVLASTGGKVFQSQDLATDAGTGIPCVVGTFQWDGGDQRAQPQFGDLYLDCFPSVTLLAQPVWLSAPVGPVTPIAAATTRTYTPISLGGSTLAKYIGLQISWQESFSSGLFTSLELWQPSLIPQPEITTDRVGDWIDCGRPGNKFFQGLLVKADTFNVAKNVMIQDSDSLALHVLQPAAIKQSGESIQAYSFIKPFVAHLVRDVPQDSVPWRRWSLEYIWQPCPEFAQTWQSQATAHGLQGYMSIYRIEAAYSAPMPVDLSIGVEDGTAPAMITLPATVGYQKLLLTPTFNKFQLATYTATSNAPCALFLEDWIVWLLPWNRQGPAIRYTNLGGSFGDKAEI